MWAIAGCDARLRARHRFEIEDIPAAMCTVPEMDDPTQSDSGAARETGALTDEDRDLVMSAAAFARFTEALDAPAEQVPEIVEMFRLTRIPTAGGVRDDLDWFVGSAPVSSIGEEDAAQGWLDSMPAEQE